MNRKIIKLKDFVDKIVDTKQENVIKLFLDPLWSHMCTQTYYPRLMFTLCMM